MKTQNPVETLKKLETQFRKDELNMGMINDVSKKLKKKFDLVRNQKNGFVIMSKKGEQFTERDLCVVSEINHVWFTAKNRESTIMTVGLK